jgi:hypothetical protein
MSCRQAGNHGHGRNKRCAGTANPVGMKGSYHLDRIVVSPIPAGLLGRQFRPQSQVPPRITRDLGALHVFHPPVSEGREDDVLVDVVADPGSAQRRAEQELAARPQHPAQFRPVTRPVVGGQVMKAASIQADVNYSGSQRQPKQIRLQVTRAGIALCGGRDGDRRQATSGRRGPGATQAREQTDATIRPHAAGVVNSPITESILQDLTSAERTHLPPGEHVFPVFTMRAQGP